MLGKGVENLKNWKNEILETDTDFLLLLVLIYDLNFMHAVSSRVNSSLHITILIQAGGIHLPGPKPAWFVLDYFLQMLPFLFIYPYVWNAEGTLLNIYLFVQDNESFSDWSIPNTSHLRLRCSMAQIKLGICLNLFRFRLTLQSKNRSSVCKELEIKLHFMSCPHCAHACPLPC